MDVNAPAWCSRCGAPASVVAETIDRRYPIVRCLREDRSCGRTVGTRVEAQAKRAWYAWQLRKARA